MAAHDLDILVLGRPANIRYVAGAPLLWNAGTRPFAPVCILVRGTGAVHLLSTWDEGVPEEIPHDHLFGITWNPMNILTALQGVEGAAEARRVGTDSMSPLFARLLPAAFPAAQLVDGEPAMQAGRRIKTSEELSAIREAIGVAEAGLAAAVAALRPGVRERELTGVFMDTIARRGVTIPATQDVARITSRRRLGRRSKQDETIAATDLVTFDAAVVANGYTGEVARTWPASGNGPEAAPRSLYRRWDELWARLLDACQPGAPGAALLTAYEKAGEPLPPLPVARGLGMGGDSPVVVRDLPATAAGQRLDPGVVLALTAYVTDDEAGAVLGQEAVLITAQEPAILSSSPFWTTSPRAPINPSTGHSDRSPINR
jgi:Xaa-Pro aminopeptidase